MRLLPLLGAALLVAGCGSTTGSAAPPTPAQPTSAQSPPAEPAQPSSAPPAVGRASGPPPHGCAAPAAAVTVTDADDGGVVCVTVGGRVTLALAGHGWQTPAVDDGAVLKPASGNGFTAVAAGKTSITSSHPACPAGTVTCHALRAFRVRIVVS